MLRIMQTQRIGSIATLMMLMNAPLGSVGYLFCQLRQLMSPQKRNSRLFASEVFFMRVFPLTAASTVAGGEACFCTLIQY